MRDRFGREIDYVRISVTDRCNLRCVYCMPEEGVKNLEHDEVLSYDEIVRFCKIFALLGLKKVKITGGEPLVRKNLAELVREVRGIDGIESVTLTTNGLLLEKECDNLVEAGISAINISLDSLNAVRYKELTRLGKVEEVVRGIEKALQYPVPVKLNAVPNYISDDEIVELARFVKDKRLHLRFIELMPIGIGQEYLYNQMENSNQQERISQLLVKEFGKLEECKEKLGNGPSKYSSLPDFKGKIGFISAISHKFCHECNRVRLTSNGFLKVCLQYELGENLFPLLRNKAEDGQIIEKIEQALGKKPLGHEFLDESMQKSIQKHHLAMAQIGG